MKFLVKKTPDSFIKTVNEEINSILNRNYESLFPDFLINEVQNEEKFIMPIELHEHEKEYCVRAELPGVKKDDLDIDIDKNHITINAKKEEETKSKDHNYTKTEFKYGEFSRTIYFPSEIDIDKTTADLEHGILKIKAPKISAEKENVKKLKVN